MKVLVTGTADGDEVVGIDNMSDYYDVTLKQARLARFADHPNYTHVHADLTDRGAIEAAFATHQPQRVINLVFASASSVYGANTDMPFSEHQSAEHPLTLYAATKKANEQMAHSYAHLYGIRSTGLRFFNGLRSLGPPGHGVVLVHQGHPGGRDDQGLQPRSPQTQLHHIDHIVEGVVRILDKPPVADPDWNSDAPDPASSGVAPYRLYNIGNEQPVQLLKYIEVLEQCMGWKAKKWT